MNAQLDHLVVGGIDLGLLVAWWAQQAGSYPARGGSHPGFGTRNAVIGVDSTTYVELIATDPDQPEPEQPRPFGLDGLEPGSVQLCTYVVAVDDIDAGLAALRAAGLRTGRPHRMARTRADGVELSWRLAIPPHQGLGGIVPALIQWDDGVSHPGSSLEPAVAISELNLGLPDPAPLQAAFDAIGFNAIGFNAIGFNMVLERSTTPSLAATFTTAEGATFSL